MLDHINLKEISSMNIAFGRSSESINYNLFNLTINQNWVPGQESTPLPDSFGVFHPSEVR